jgi:hypothetical protein
MRALTPLVALTLAACGGESTRNSAAASGEVEMRNASVAEVAEQARAASAATRFQPGQWRSTAEVVDIQMPGMPAGMAEQLRQQMMSRSSVTSCMTEEQSANPSESLFGGQRGQCRFDRFSMKAGRIDAVMTCAGDGREVEAARITLTGTFDATHFETESTIESTGGERGRMSMRSRVKGERVGACT